MSCETPGSVGSSGADHDGNSWFEGARYALYKYADDNIELLSSSLHNEHHSNLQSFLLRRLKKGAIYFGSGNFSVMEFSLALLTKSPATCFYISLPCWGDTSQVICCLLAPSEAHLDLFTSELQQFCTNVVHRIKAGNMKPADVKGSTLERELEAWPQHSLEFLNRVVGTLGPNIAYALQAALQPHKLEISKEMSPELAADLTTFIAAASVAGLLTNSQGPLGPKPELKITFSETGAGQEIECSPFCHDWAKLIARDPFSSSAIKKALESFKLKTIKDMNTLRRLLKQAETDHYSLYSACTFLRQSGNSQVLLYHAQDDGDSPRDVIDILQKYLSEEPIK